LNFLQLLNVHLEVRYMQYWATKRNGYTSGV